MMQFWVPILMVKAVTGLLGEPDVGVAAYYREGLMEKVCRFRMANGWVPDGVVLDCDFPCLAAAIEPDTRLGQYAVVQMPSGALRVCHIVDVGSLYNLSSLRERGEVIEFDYQTAMDLGMSGYVSGVMVWWVDDYHTGKGLNNGEGERVEDKAQEDDPVGQRAQGCRCGSSVGTIRRVQEAFRDR